MNYPFLSDPILIAALAVPMAPFAAFGFITIFLRGRHRAAAGLSIAAVSVSLAGAVFLLARNWHMASPILYSGPWVSTGGISIPLGVLLDPVSLVMLLVVTGISFLVQVYSLGYMAGDPGFSRYFGFMSLFAWAMTSLTLSPTLLQLYVFWELVGLASYLLIGFWFEKFSASEAGKKAFVMTRLGDVAFLLGLLLVLSQIGNLDILTLTAGEAPLEMPPALLTLSILLIFGGIVGKSAQFPLLTWLPDAMEGPTPVSALLHSATMVAAGVYLFARLFPFFSLSQTAMAVCLAVGTLSMLLASTMAMVSRDIKQVWAYSTISQLGFMIMGLAAGSFFAGTFHLTTHAGFKALLFLCSGVFIHHFHTNDMVEIGRAGGRGLMVPMLSMIVAAAALSGLPPLSGFFSKEAILAALAGLDNPVWLWAGLLGAFLTAYYAFRLIFIILFPEVVEKGEDREGAAPEDPGPGDHRDGAEWAMAVPLVILVAVTVSLGFAHGPLERFLTATAGVSADARFADPPGWLFYTAIGLATAGVILAWLEFGRPGADRIGFVERIPGVARFFAERWYLDRFYRWFLDTVVYGGFSALCSAGDRRVIDGAIDGLSRWTVFSGRIVSRLNSGMIQYRLTVMFAVVFTLALYLLI